MNWQRKSLRDCAPQAWRNGGGITHEMATWPADGDWCWRVSVARIDRDGPFSVFAGVQRWFAVLEGQGVELCWTDATLRLGVSDDPHTFPGEHPCDARLLDGPTLDFNLMARGLGGHLRRQQHKGKQAPWPANAHVGVFACTDCNWTSDRIPQNLKSREFAWMHTTEVTAWDWHDGQALVFVLQEEQKA